MRAKESLADRYSRMAEPELQLTKDGYSLIAGVDEAGRGPLAGPVFAAAVILHPDKPIWGLNDSKKLTEKSREQLFDTIQNNALAYSIAQASVEEIAELNILGAAGLAMERAVKQLETPPDYVLYDYIKLEHPFQPSDFLKQGDAKANCIAAASILAKVARDHYLLELDKIYPQYQFAKHKGYGTKLHYAMLDQFGPCPAHREQFLRSWRDKQS